jgi:hypothetical protein
MTDKSTVFDAAFEYNMNGMSIEAAADAAAYDDERDARIAGLEGDKADLMRVVTDLLGRVDDLMTPVDGYLSMHTCGQSPDWFVEAAVLGAYGTLKAKP